MRRAGRRLKPGSAAPPCPVAETLGGRPGRDALAKHAGGRQRGRWRVEALDVRLQRTGAPVRVPLASETTVERLAQSDRNPEPADPHHFQGAARLTRFLSERPGSKGRVYRVAFDPGARTHWHVHDDVQILYVLDGRCRVQRWGGPVTTAEAGDVVRIDAAEKHWHGATADGPMTHLALNLGDRTEWMEAVED